MHTYTYIYGAKERESEFCPVQIKCSCKLSRRIFRMCNVFSYVCIYCFLSFPHFFFCFFLICCLFWLHEQDTPIRIAQWMAKLATHNITPKCKIVCTRETLGKHKKKIDRKKKRRWRKRTKRAKRSIYLSVQVIFIRIPSTRQRHVQLL